MTCDRLLEEALADVYGEEKDEDEEAGLLPPPQWRGKQHRTPGQTEAHADPWLAFDWPLHQRPNRSLSAASAQV